MNNNEQHHERIPGRIGLIAAGGVNQSFLARMPALLKRLGPLKGPSLQISRRLANGLKVGVGVSDYRSFEACDLIWIAIPETTLDAVVDELAGHIQLEHKMIVLCDVMKDSSRLGALRIAGAHVASLNCVPASNERIFAAEGHPAVIGQLRKLVGSNNSCGTGAYGDEPARIQAGLLGRLRKSEARRLIFCCLQSLGGALGPIYCGSPDGDFARGRQVARR